MSRRVHHDGDLPPQAWAAPVEGPYEPSMARQSEKDSADVNFIMARYERTGELPAFGEGRYADVSEIGDYRAALEKVQLADEQFRQLPAKVRAAFGNDPAEFLDSVSAAARGDDEQTRRLIELGLAAERKPADKPAEKPPEVPAAK